MYLKASKKNISTGPGRFWETCPNHVPIKKVMTCDGCIGEAQNSIQSVEAAAVCCRSTVREVQKNTWKTRIAPRLTPAQTLMVKQKETHPLDKQAHPLGE